MKRTLSIVLAMIMLLSSICVSAEDGEFNLEEIKVEYSIGAEQSNNIEVKGTYNKSLVLRVFNENNELEYIGTISSNENTFEFKPFQLKKPQVTGKTGTTTKEGNNDITKYAFEYRFVISDENSILNKDNEAVAFEYSTIKTNNNSSGGLGPGGGTKPDPEPVPPWDPKPNPTDVTTDTTTDTADKDPLDKGGSNKPLWDKVNKVTSSSGAASAIDAITNKTDKEELKGETARNNVAVAVETMTANIGAKSMSVSPQNELFLSPNSVGDRDMAKWSEASDTIAKSLKKNNISLNRSLKNEYILNVQFNNKKTAKITVTKEFVDKLKKAGIDTLTIKDKDFRTSYSISEMYEMLGNKKETSFEIDKTGMVGTTKKIAVNFDTDKTKVMKIAFPGLDGDNKYMAIVDEKGNPVGGRYNPVTGAVEAKITESGVYQLVNNEKDFEDIKTKSNEMQESIKILAAKGIIEGTSEKEFSPDDTITRAEIAALILRVLSQIDPNAEGGFDDVKKSDWFYGTAGSAKAYGIINGFDDNTFRGNAVIEKDQILAVSARVLRREMKYKTPENINEWLTFTDAAEIADWAKEDLALATMANIITRNKDNTIKSTEDMTRGDAALIIMRLFYKVW